MKKKAKTILLIVTITFLIALSVPIIGFIVNFKSMSISPNISDWAAFGDYIGGTLNTIISFSSLIILSYLTYLVSAQSNVENKNINLLLRRLDAYEKLTAFFPEINSFLFNIKKSSERLLNKFRMVPIDYDLINEEKNELNKQIKIFSDFYYFLFSFNARYGHLFKYDFNETIYVEILTNGEKLRKYFESTGEIFDSSEKKLENYDSKLTEKFFDDLVILLNALREELK